MSDNDNNGTTKSSTAWTEHELLVCVLNTIERNNIKLDFSNTPLPPGRNANGLRQKINALKRTIKAEMDALNEGHPMPDTIATPKKSGGRKRKAVEGDNADEQVDTPNKKSRGRPKKTVSEPIIKGEPDIEAGHEVGTEEEF